MKLASIHLNVDHMDERGTAGGWINRSIRTYASPMGVWHNVSQIKKIEQLISLIVMEFNVREQKILMLTCC